MTHHPEFDTQSLEGRLEALGRHMAPAPEPPPTEFLRVVRARARTRAIVRTLPIALAGAAVLTIAVLNMNSAPRTPRAVPSPLTSRTAGDNISILSLRSAAAGTTSILDAIPPVRAASGASSEAMPRVLDRPESFRARALLDDLGAR